MLKSYGVFTDDNNAWVRPVETCWSVSVSSVILNPLRASGLKADEWRSHWDVEELIQAIKKIKHEIDECYEAEKDTFVDALEVEVRIDLLL